MNEKQSSVASPNPVGYWFRVLRPLFWWVVLVLVLYGIRTHQRLMEQTRIDFSISTGGGNLIAQGLLFGVETAKLDGRWVNKNDKISLGSHTFTISQPGFEPYQTNFFAFYGLRNLGQIELRREHGTLTVRASPPATTITITGQEFSTTLHDCSSTNLVVPTDSYTVQADYPHWSQTLTTKVVSGPSAACVFTPELGALHLTCNHDAAFYQLQLLDGQAVANGNLPATVSDLAVGNYQLMTSYHNLQSKQSVRVESGQTNDVPITFVLGAAHLETIPAGATVRTADGNYLGLTPLNLPDLAPQTARYNLSLWGYEPASVTLVISADQTTDYHTNLISTAYISAMQEAKNNLSTGNYSGVMQATRAALNAQPNDADAAKLQNEASEHLSLERQKLAALKRPKQAFDDLCRQYENADLFTEHELKSPKPAKELTAAIVQAFQSNSAGFKVIYSKSPDPQTYAMVWQESFSLGILGGAEHDCLVVVSQSKDDETQIWFKVLEYQVQHTVVANSLLSYHDNKQLIPVHPSRIQMTDSLRSQVTVDIQTVTDIIRQAIDK